MATTQGDKDHGASGAQEMVPLVSSNPGSDTAKQPTDYGSTGTGTGGTNAPAVAAPSTQPDTYVPSTGMPPILNSGSTRITPFQKGGDETHGETFDDVPKELRRLGLPSATTLIFNFVIGTGIYASPGLILHAAGSVGVAVIMWVLGALIAAAGTFVYVEYGTGLPKSGGEKNYLEFTFHRPQYLMTCVFAVYSSISRSNADSSIVFGKYALRALGIEPTPEHVRKLAYYCLSFATFIHGTNVTLGVRIQNALGIFKIVVLLAISIFGLLSLAGVQAFQVRDGYEKPHNFEWNNLWEGTNVDPNAFVTGVYNVLWSFVGYQNANYALSEVKNPVRTLKTASMIGVSIVAAIYVLVNIAYFAVVSKNDMLDQDKVVVSLFFRNLFGEQVEKALSAIVALSVLGSVLAGQFAQGRVIQELGREGVFPASGFLSSTKPFNSPFAGLFVQYLISCGVLFVTPHGNGDGFLFLVSLGSYCILIVNTLVSVGLLLIHVKGYSAFQWNPPVRSPRIFVILYFVSNVLLLIVPFIPPTAGRPMYRDLPYWSHSVTAFAMSLVGCTYWYLFAVWHPWKYGYELVKEFVRASDGISRFQLRKVPLAVAKVQSGEERAGDSE